MGRAGIPPVHIEEMKMTSQKDKLNVETFDKLETAINPQEARLVLPMAGHVVADSANKVSKFKGRGASAECLMIVGLFDVATSDDGEGEIEFSIKVGDDVHETDSIPFNEPRAIRETRPIFLNGEGKVSTSAQSQWKSTALIHLGLAPDNGAKVNAALWTAFDTRVVPMVNALVEERLVPSIVQGKLVVEPMEGSTPSARGKAIIEGAEKNYTQARKSAGIGSRGTPSERSDSKDKGDSGETKPVTRTEIFAIVERAIAEIERGDGAALNETEIKSLDAIRKATARMNAKGFFELDVLEA